MSDMSKFDCVRALEAKGIETADMDERVHDSASSLGTDANNGGLLEQVYFLHESCGWSYEDILKAAKKEG